MQKPHDFSDTQHFRSLVSKRDRTGRALFEDAADTKTAIIVNAVITFGIIIPNALVFAFLEHLYGTYHTIVIVDILAAITALAGFLYLFLTKNVTVSSYVNVGLVGVLFITLLLTSSTGNAAYFWSLCYPITALFILGARKGTIAVIAFVGVIFVLFFLPINHGMPLCDYEPGFKLRFLGAMFALYLAAFLYEYVRVQNQKNLHIKNRVLERAVREIQFKEDHFRFLSKSSIELMSFSSEKEIYEYVGRHLAELITDSVIIPYSLVEKQAIRLSGIYGLDLPGISQGISLLGYNPLE